MKNRRYTHWPLAGALFTLSPVHDSYLWKAQPPVCPWLVPARDSAREHVGGRAFGALV